MDIKRLSHFIALAEEGRFTLAADRVHLSQAAFSRSIQALEEQTGLRLFDRGAKGARLTPAGELVLVRARALVQGSRGLLRDIALIQQGDIGHIQIGAGPIPAALLVPDLLVELRRHSPQLLTRVHVGGLPQLLEQLDAQEIDFCMGDPRLMDKSPRYEMVSLGKQTGGLYCRSGHPLARKRALPPEVLSAYGIAQLPMTRPLLQGVARACGFASVDAFPRAVECDDLLTLAHLVAQTDVLGILPHVLARKAGLRPLLPTQAPALIGDVHAIWLKGRTQSPSAERAIASARQIGLRLAGESSGR